MERVKKGKLSNSINNLLSGLHDQEPIFKLIVLHNLTLTASFSLKHTLLLLANVALNFSLEAWHFCYDGLDVSMTHNVTRVESDKKNAFVG